MPNFNRASVPYPPDELLRLRQAKAAMRGAAALLRHANKAK
jgi:hypothetical protein